MMKTYYAFLSVFGLIAMAASSQASDYTFTTLDYPGAQDTYPHGVSGSTVVGAAPARSPARDQARSRSAGARLRGLSSRAAPRLGGTSRRRCPPRPGARARGPSARGPP